MKLGYYTISVDVEQMPEGLACQLAYQLHHNELYISANLKLAGDGAAAYIDNIDVAMSYLGVCKERLERRYGCEVQLKIENWLASADQRLAKKITNDTKLVKARMAQGIYSANKQPVLN